MSRIFGIVPFALGLVVFCVWIPTPGFALKCHVCNSLTNETCDFLKDDRYLVDCNSLDTGEKQNYTNCRKEAFSASSAKFDMYTKRTIRSCGIERHYRSSCFYSSNIDLKGSTCECEEDGCNGGSVLHSVARIILTVVLCGFLASVLTT